MSTFAWRVLAGCGLLMGLAFTQDPGYLVADTKFDLVAAPGDFVVRALHLWDGEGAFGQLQNQAYGYLFPTAPFFLTGVLAGLPGWVVQRLWWGLVLAVAFAGTARLVRALGVRSDLACLLAGAAYALSPRMLTTMGPISSESWPMALAPWVLLPLVVGAQRGSPRLAAAWAGVAAACVGGINAAAAFAVIPLGVVWLLTRTRGPRRRALMLWWPVFTFLGTLWWLVPLVVMGAYSPPFLDWIETASVTTFPTTVADALRGTSNWVAYIDTTSRAGRDLLSTPYLALDAGVLLLLGCAGMVLRSNPHRAFLARGLAVGLVLVTLGHEGAVQGWGAATLHDLLDGVLSPIRNVHKFDPIIRLPLVIGLAYAVEQLRAGSRTGSGATRQQRLSTAVLTATAVAVVAAGAMPALTGRIAPREPVVAVPGYWSATAQWLEEQDAAEGDATALLVPGSGFGRYQWGSPDDEPLQWLADSRWAVRNVVPLVPAGQVRTLDGIERRLAEGRGSPGLADALARAGVRYVVVRNDLTRADDVPDPLLVRQALQDSPGLVVAETFGPVLGGEARLEGAGGERVVVGGGWQTRYRAVEVWAVDGAERAVLAEDLPVVVGGPEDLADLADLGAVDERPGVLAVDLPEDLGSASADDLRSVLGPLVLTDGLRLREHAFARTHDSDSPVLEPGAPRRNGNPTRDYEIGDPAQDARWRTAARLEGVAALDASSSDAWTSSLGPVRRGAQPWAALDGDLRTAFRTGPFAAGTQWWEVTLEEERALERLTITGGPGALEDQRVRVVTDTGVTEELALGPGQTRAVLLDGGPTTTLRVESAVPDRPLHLAEVEVPDLDVRRPWVLPAVPESWLSVWDQPDVIALRADRDPRTGCVVASDLRRTREETRCDSRRAVEDEEPDGLDRVVTLSGEAAYDEVTLRGRPRAGAALDSLVVEGRAIAARASSTAVEDPRAGALAAIDGDPGTTWVADPAEDFPSLEVSWLEERDVAGLRVRLDPDTAASRPTALRLTWPGGTRDVDLVEGRADLSEDPVTTDRLRLQVLGTEPTRDLGFDGVGRPVGAGISELRLLGVPYEPLKPSLEPRRFACGTGPDLEVGDRVVPTRLVAAPATLLAGDDVELRACGRDVRREPALVLTAGETRIRMTDTAAVEAVSVVLGSLPSGPDPAPVAVAEEPATRVFDLPEGRAGVLVSRENANPGWSAELEAPSDGAVGGVGGSLGDLTVDGWQQAWLVPAPPAEDTRVVATFGPDLPYRAGLGLGALTLVLLLLGTLVATWRRGRRSQPVGPVALGTRRHGPFVAGLTATLVGGLLAGTVGAGVGAVLGLLVPVLLRRVPAAADALPWVLAGPLLAVGAAYAVRPWGDPAGWAGALAWPSYLALVPVLGALAMAADSSRRRASGWRPFRRSAGRSTSR
ncbi:alpha-(1-_3)-arabinofuranosyltransferase family protein [uncultured Nocardioides sp.]|uniref:alpha-(1->3)-arabinofuranosyltransferase domain-containing protein n=1 Tax=uncultured Nocardioides sp. TaxID=198441 RepID=UPI00261E79BC|nr:alpha-(1->3)-arabinofuranosyltransferase family protein [uncultured Nocardioides sp.]